PDPARRTARRVSPGGARAYAGQARRLAGDRAALVDPGGEGIDIEAARVLAMRADPLLHAFEQLRRELAVRGVQREIRFLRFAQAIEAQVGVAAVLDGFRIVRLESQ